MYQHVCELPNLLLASFERTELFKKCRERVGFQARTEVRAALTATHRHGTGGEMREPASRQKKAVEASLEAGESCACI